MINILIMKLKLTKQMLPVIAIMTGMALLFIFIFGRGFTQVYKPVVYIVDEDQSEASEQLIERIESNEGYEFISDDLEVSLTSVDEGKAIMTVHIKDGFEDSLYEEDVQIKLYVKSSAIETATLQNTISTVVTELASNRKFAESFAAGFEGTPISVNEADVYDDVVLNTYDYPANIVSAITPENVAAESYDSIKHYFAGFMVFFSLFTIMFGIGTIVDEKESNVWSRQLVGPVKRLTIIVGNLIGNFILGMGQLLIIVLIAKFGFGIDWGGSIAALLLVLAAFSMAGTSIGLLVAGFMNTEQQLSSILPTIIVSTSMIGGCMWPLSIISNKFLLFLADLTPQRWAMEGVKTVLISNGQIGDVIQPVIYMLIMSLVFLILSIYPFSKPAVK